MFTLIITLHVIFCIFLILAILLQTGKGAGIGAAFGGGSQTVFGPRGAGSFIGKLTGIVAALFMLTSLSLAYMSSSGSSGIEDKVTALNEEKASLVEEVELGQSTEAPDTTASSGTGAATAASGDAGKEESSSSEDSETPDTSTGAPSAENAADSSSDTTKAADEPPKPEGLDSKAPRPAGLDSKADKKAKPKKAKPEAAKPEAAKPESATTKANSDNNPY